VHVAVLEHKASFGVQTTKRNSDFARSFSNVAMGLATVEARERIVLELMCSRVSDCQLWIVRYGRALNNTDARMGFAAHLK
jgi:hypothetical protein